MRLSVAVGHPDFGKSVKCDGVAHQAEELKRLGKISRLVGKELAIRLNHIKPYNKAFTTHCPHCQSTLQTQIMDGRKIWQCDSCGLNFYGNPATNLAMIEAARLIIARLGHGFWWFEGGWGNAKSVIGKAIVNECNLNGYGPAIYASLADIASYIKDSYGIKTADQGESEATRRLNELIGCPVLVVDEGDKVNETNWLYEFRSRFLDKRYNLAMSGDKYAVTVFISNLSPQQFNDGALYSRFNHNGGERIIANTAPDARPTERWEDIYAKNKGL